MRSTISWNGRILETVFSTLLGGETYLRNGPCCRQQIATAGDVRSCELGTARYAAIGGPYPRARTVLRYLCYLLCSCFPLSSNVSLLPFRTSAASLFPSRYTRVAFRCSFRFAHISGSAARPANANKRGSMTAHLYLHMHADLTSSYRCNVINTASNCAHTTAQTSEVRDGIRRKPRSNSGQTRHTQTKIV